MRTLRMVASGAVLALASAILPAAALAATVDGTIISNVVSATYSTTVVPGPSSGYSVSYSATARVLAQDPCIDIQKEASPSEGQVAGEVVTFKIWVINCSASASAYNIMVYDQLPLNTTKLAASFGSEPPPDWAIGYSLNGIDGPWVADDPLIESTGTGNEWLRFLLSKLGPNKSAWVVYEVTIQ